MRLLDQMASGRRVFGALAILTACLVGANVLASVFYDQTGGYGLLDLAGARNALEIRPVYTPDEAYALMTAWGPHGRDLHLALTLTSDLVLPLIGFLTGVLAVRYATREARRRWLPALLFALPVAYVLSDYAENTAIVGLLLAYPAHHNRVAEFASVAYAVKNLVGPLTVVVALTVAVIRAARTGRPGPTTPSE